MNRRGTTLIETVIAIFLISVVVVTFLEALSIGINGTLDLSRKTSALNLAKSQMEYVQAQDYKDYTGALEDVYGLIITDNGDNGDISDIVNYVISGEVANASERALLQEITVSVNYLAGKKDVQIKGYKTASGDALPAPPPQGKLVTEVIEFMPFLPTGGFWMWGNWCGYYQVIETQSTGYISATWRFDWHRDVPGIASAGSPWILIYGPDPAYPGENRAPHWAMRDYLGNVLPSGFVCRGASNLCAGCPPAPAGTCLEDYDGDYAPIAQLPPYNCVVYSEHLVGVARCFTLGLGCAENWFPSEYEWCMTNLSWYDDNNCDGVMYNSGTMEFTVTTDTPVDPGTYTILFFNGETTISFETISASLTYVN